MAHDVAENIRSHETIRDIIAAIPNDEPVIIGGDFNGAGGDPNWPASSTPDGRLQRVCDCNPNYVMCLAALAGPTKHFINGKRVWPLDHILVRGAYAITLAERVAPTDPNPSDHRGLCRAHAT